jgi:hypothetical protein
MLPTCAECAKAKVRNSFPGFRRSDSTNTALDPYVQRPVGFGIQLTTCSMPDKGSNEKQSPVSKEALARRNWYKPNRVTIRDAVMYDVGDNANLNISESYINTDTVVFMMHHSEAPSASHIDPSPTGGENGSSDRVSYRALR